MKRFAGDWLKSPLFLSLVKARFYWILCAILGSINMSSFVFKGKMVIVGDIAVGKTSLASRFVDDKFTKNHNASVGGKSELANSCVVAYFTKTMVVDDKLTVKFDIWDTAGQGVELRTGINE